MSFNENYWQAKVGLEKEFEVLLRRLRGQNADITVEAADIQVFSLIFIYMFQLVQACVCIFILLFIRAD